MDRLAEKPLFIKQSAILQFCFKHINIVPINNIFAIWTAKGQTFVTDVI